MMDCVTRIDLDYFFKRPDSFPWSTLGLDRPNVGPLHCYICRALTVYRQNEPNAKMLGCSSWSEFCRFAKQGSDNLKDIQKFCEKVKEYPGDYPAGVARQVLEWLSQCYDFRDFMQKVLSGLYDRGMIELPSNVATRVVI